MVWYLVAPQSVATTTCTISIIAEKYNYIMLRQLFTSLPIGIHSPDQTKTRCLPACPQDDPSAHCSSLGGCLLNDAFSRENLGKVFLFFTPRQMEQTATPHSQLTFLSRLTRSTLVELVAKRGACLVGLLPQ